MKKVILFTLTTLISLSSFAVSRGDIEAASAFAYEKTSVNSSEQSKREFGEVYLAVLKMENGCFSGQLDREFCDSESVSEVVVKMESLRNEQLEIMEGNRTPEVIGQVNALIKQRNLLGESLLKNVLSSLATLRLK